MLAVVSPAIAALIFGAPGAAGIAALSVTEVELLLVPSLTVIVDT